MTTFDQELTGRYVAAGGDRPDPDAQRVARTVFVRDTIRTLVNADKEFGIDPADNGSLAELADAAEDHRAHRPRRQPAISHGAAHHRRRHRMRKHHSTLGGVALAMALILTGCGDDDPDPKTQETPSESPSPTPTSSPTPKTPEEKATAQLTGYLQVRDDALRAATIDFKRLNKVATGQEFLNLQQNVSGIERSGSKVTGEYVHTLGEPRDRGSEMLITDCEDRSGVQRTKDGKPVPEPKDPEGNPLRNPVPIEYELVKQKGRWLVTSSNVLWDESC
jgi:hypothetical protein